ncbi:hypothetical protein DMENIID0001_007170 [Sergentomyia squamirostris]
MKCLMNASNAKRFQKILQSLSKIGVKLFLEALPSGLYVRTESTSNTSFAKIHLSTDFFMEYHERLPQNVGSFDNKCQVSLKALLSVLRHLKHVERCVMKLNLDEQKLTMRMRCAEEILKTFNIPLLEQEIHDVSFAQDVIANSLMCSRELFSDLMSNNFNSEPELTMDFTLNGVVVKNYIDDRIVDKSVMRTRVTVYPEEFQEYLLAKDTRLTFCLKSFRAFLSLVDAINSKSGIKMDFNAEGEPVNFSVNENQIVGSLLMSTLARDDYENSMMSFDENINSIIHPSNQSKSTSSKKRQKSPPVERAESLERTKRSKPEKPAGQLITNSYLQNADTLVNSQISLSDTPVNESILRHPPIIELHEEASEQASSNQNQSENTASSSFNNTFHQSSSNSHNPARELIRIPETDDPAEDELDRIPPSPPTQEEVKRARAKARRIFKRCFEPTFHESQISGRSNIIVPNSDSE